MNKHIISKDKTLLEALSQINDLAPEPLVLFVVDEEQRMIGTLTDGDSRRALISGASVVSKRTLSSITILSLFLKVIWCPSFSSIPVSARESQ